jgi:acetyl-CoA carboxylase carboxyl transferase subunit alpha
MEQLLEFEKPLAEIEKMIEKLKKLTEDDKGDFANQIRELEEKLGHQKEEIYAHLTPWQTVQIARHPRRPVLQDYLGSVFTDFIELHGDRLFADDRALIGGFATLGNQRVMVLGHNKGRSVDENVERNFGMANPEGYRKALRLMRLAERYGLPVISLIDTPAASPVKEAEERGQAEAIAHNMVEMARLEVPIIVIVIGEGGSGGAIGIGVGDAVLMLSNAIYSVIPPEGCAVILWRDSSFAPQAAESLKITASSLLQLKVIDEIVDEAGGGAHNDPRGTALHVKKALIKHLDKLKGVSTTKLLQRRFEKFEGMGVFIK